MARRFIVNKENIKRIDASLVTIYSDEVKHIQVLRKNIGDKIIVNENIYEIVKMTRDSITLKYIEKAPEIGIPSENITLYIALLKGEKLDFVVQKAVEIGVKNIVLFTSSNVIVKLDEKGVEKRILKLQKIADEAVKQCGRSDRVTVTGVLSFDTLKEEIAKEEKVLFAYEGSKCSLKEELKDIKKYKNVGIIIGAEGGFTKSEADDISSISNTSCVSLGDRILRAETSAINLLSIVIYEMED